MIKSISLKNKDRYIVCIAAFFLYFVLGFICNYINGFDLNVFFGTDNFRAFGDFAYVDANHYRVKVHPLLLVLWQPLFAFFKFLFSDVVLAVITVHAACGAACVGLVYSFLLKFVERKRVVLFTLIYTFSFGMIVFSGSCETHIFSGLMINLLIYYGYELLTSNEPLKRTQKLILAFIGVGCFGTTITNVVMFVILVFFLVFSKIKTKKLMNLIEIFLYFSFMAGFLLVVQKIAWRHSPVFFITLLDAFFDKTSFEEYNYLNTTFSIEKACEWYRQMFCYPVISSDVDIFYVESLDFFYVDFEKTSIFNYIICGTFYLMFIFSGIRYYVKKGKHRFITSVLLCLLAFNYCFHFFYGYTGAFMYSPFYLSMLIILFAIFTNDIKGVSNFMTAFFVYQAINNIIMYAMVIIDLRTIYGTGHQFIRLLLKLVCVIVVYGLILIGYKFINKKPKNASFEEKLKKVFLSYGAWMLIYSFFVFIGQWRA